MKTEFLKLVNGPNRLRLLRFGIGLASSLYFAATALSQTAPIIITQPAGQNAMVGSNVTFSVVANGGVVSFPSVSSGTLQLWLKADAGVVTNTAGQVTQWQDQSGNTNNAVQAATNRQPSLVYDSGLGGRAAIRFNGVQDGTNGDFLQGTGDVGIPNAMTSFLFYNAFSSTVIANVPWLVGVPGTAWGASRYDVLDSDQMIFGTWTYAYYAPYYIPTNTYRVWNDRINTNLTAVQMYDFSARGSTNFTENLSQPTFAPQPGYYVGGLDNSLYGVNYQFTFQGNVAELIIYKGYLSDADRLAVINYLQQKYYQVGDANGLSFQWQFDGANIAGATNSNLTLTDVQTNEAGSYSVIVSNLTGSSTISSNAVLASGYLPSITTQPQTQEAIQGSNVLFTTDASGTGPLSYQWYFDGTSLAADTNSALTVTNVQSANLGFYSVSVSNPFGSILSSNAVLTGNFYSLGTMARLEGPSAGLDSVVLAVVPNSASWTNTANAPWLHLGAADQNGIGSTNLIFSYDANLGATRSGTLNIAGQTLTVTQAGFTYVKAGSVTTLISASSYQNGVAVDSAGNVYVSDYGNNTLEKWTASNNAVTFLVSSGLSGPQGIAVDNAGNVYIADSGDGTIKEWTAANSNLTTLVSSGLNAPEGVGVDAFGNVYIADTFNNSLKEWIAATGNVTNLNSSGLNQPNRLAVDVAGNVYIGDYNNSAVQEWMPSTDTLTTLVSGLNGVDGVAVDGAGNVFATDYTDGKIEEWSAASNTVTTLVSSGLNEPESVAVDSTGNVYIADTWNYALKELPYAFVDSTPKIEGAAAGSDTLPGVLPATENLLPPFAPTSDSPWLTITGITNDVVSFSFSATSAARVGHILLLGQSIPILQDVILPAITSSPSNQTVAAGASVTFNASAAGSPPLSYQWLFDGTNLLGATNTSLTLSNVTVANAGSYWMVVSNAYGSATSLAAVLTVDETTIQVVSTNAVGGNTIVVSINVNAIGTEAALGFSLDFDPNVLTFQGVVLGSGAAGGALQVNSNFVASGSLGIVYGGTFSPGTNDAFDVTFQVLPVTNATTTILSFGNQPTGELVSDSQPQALPAIFVPGNVIIPITVLEGDVSPLTNGNDVLNILDWVQEGRFVAGLDTASNGIEFQQADCAPRDTLGDGELTVADWVQVGRYVAGLDPLTAAGGPTSPVTHDSLPGHPFKTDLPRSVTIVPLSQGGLTDSAAVQIVAQGNESSLGFSITFDPATIIFVNASLGSGATGATLIQNTTQAASGQLGFVVGLLAPGTFTAGTLPLVNLHFASLVYSNNAILSFGDNLVVRQLVDSKAEVLPVNFQNATLSIGGAVWPTLSVSQTGTNLVLAWPVTPAAFTLQTASSLGGDWSNVSAIPVTNGGSLVITSAISTNSQFFRLKY